MGNWNEIKSDQGQLLLHLGVNTRVCSSWPFCYLFLLILIGYVTQIYETLLTIIY